MHHTTRIAFRASIRYKQTIIYLNNTTAHKTKALFYSNSYKSILYRVRKTLEGYGHSTSEINQNAQKAIDNLFKKESQNL